MARRINPPFNSKPKMQPPAYMHPHPSRTNRIPEDFKEAMLHIPVKPQIMNPGMPARTPPAPKRTVRPAMWKSSFKPLDDDSPDTSAGSSQRVDIYDPYNPLSSDSENEMLLDQDHNPSLVDHDDDNDQRRQSLSPSSSCRKKRRWASCYSESISHSPNDHDFSPEHRPTESRGLSPGHRLPERQAYSPDGESLDPPGYNSISRPLDHRVCSPDRLIHSSSTQRFPQAYGGERTNGEERMMIPEMTSTVRLSPSRLQRDYQHQPKYMEQGQDQSPPPTKVSRNMNINIIMDKCPIECDLCDVELSSSRELEDHLESKSHWDTMEYIQQLNNYDDMAIAFLQEVMLYKSQQCSRAIEDGALQALQNDHMIKIEMVHCVACSMFMSTSASLVHTHITTQEHLSKLKEFQAQQRHSCLKAATIMKELKPQFESFLKGKSPFE